VAVSKSINLIIIVLFFSGNYIQAQSNDTISNNKLELNNTNSDSLMTGELNNKIDEQLKKFIPEIKKVMKDNFKKVTKSTLNNDKAMIITFRKSYQFLPLPVRLVVDQEDFVKFCMRNKHLLLQVK
jgi:hypothetical protein